MRFLSESTDIDEIRTKIDDKYASGNQFPSTVYKRLDDSKKYKYIIDVLKNMDNYKYLKPIERPIALSIIENGWESPITDYVEKIKFNVNEDTFNLINTLVINKRLSVNQDWLYKPELYDRALDDTDYTIKALTLASNKKLQKDDFGKNKFSDKALAPMYFYDNNNRILSVNEIKDKLNKWQTKGFEKDKKDKLSIKGVDLFKKLSKKEKYTFDDILNYIFNTEEIIGNNKLGYKSKIDNYLRSEDGRSQLKKALESSYTKESILGDASNEADSFKNSLKFIIDNFIKKSKEESEKEKNTKQSASKILIDNGITTMDKLLTLAAQSAYPNNEGYRTMFKSYLKTAEGKIKLNKILNSQYSDTFISSALDQIKDDLVNLTKYANK